MSIPDSAAPIPYRSSRWPARFLIWTGIGHNIVGLLLPHYRKPMIDAVKAGFFNQFGANVARSNSFWFFFAGVNLVLMGKIVDWYLFPTKDDVQPAANEALQRQGQDLKRSKRVLPRLLGTWFLGIGVVGAIAIPRSGFYLMIMQGLALHLA
ncbi:hypothetical protein BG011_005154 [Mortierella polycephala]|uniref:Uncharacterized protein n=1 Tax=Mortierella polycephala TaxID=41804 RepID=A0A9P6PWT9_9FUNG|nr:hypothetical protein BG011_005154 [Mortierella polycephala]